MGRRILRVVGRVLEVPLLLVLPVAAFVGLLVATDGWARGWPVALLVVGLLVGYLWWALRRRRIAGRLGALVPSVVAAGLIVWPLVPVGSATHQVPADSDLVATRYWELDTGSRLAYYHLPPAPGTTPKPNPIVFVHGGPGAFTQTYNMAFFAGFTRAGYDVYLYDQAGGGRSDQLPLEQYSHARNVEDFGAVLEQIGRPAIVVGQSYGAQVTMSALADPGVRPRIAKVVLSEPAGYDNELDVDFSKDPATAAQAEADISVLDTMMGKPRYLLGAFALDPPGGDFLPQAEAVNGVTDADLESVNHQCYCATDAGRIPELPEANDNLNPLANQRINDSTEGDPPLKPALADSTVPVMVMLGECSYVSRRWQTAVITDYPAIDRVQYFEGVGHHVWNGLDDNDARARESMLAFFEGRPPTLPDYPRAADLEEFIADGR